MATNIISRELRSDTLYLGDNGRAFCGTLRCAGMTAFYSGRDLSGQRIASVTPREARDHNIVCERCGVSPSFVVSA